jgi:SAM-dependent methyltransferase
LLFAGLRRPGEQHSQGRCLTRSCRPSEWLAGNSDLLPRPARDGDASPYALDLASGRGRNAFWLAEAGFDVDAIDHDERALAELEAAARARSLSVSTERMDLEQPGVSLGTARYGLIVVFRYLHRPLFPAILQALRPGGVLVYETFTTAQAARGRPTNPAFLLEPGELPRLVSPLEILRRHEGVRDGAALAGVVAAAPARTRPLDLIPDT